MNNKIKTLGEKCIKSHPDRIPVIVNYDHSIVFSDSNCKEAQTLRSNLLVHNDTTVSYLCVIIGRKAKINNIDKLNIVINGFAIDKKNVIADLYQKYKSINDGCLHVSIMH